MGRPHHTAALCVLLITTASPAWANWPGGTSPWWRLTSMTGQTYGRDSLRGSRFVLVVGRTRPSAPPCKKWVIALAKKTHAKVFQVIVAAKPWYLPRALVLKEIRKFTPAAYYRNVLVEWYTAFAKSWQIPKDDAPRVIVVDERGAVLERIRGKLTPARFAKVRAAVGAPLKVKAARR